jgi:hypothetical protein
MAVKTMNGIQFVESTGIEPDLVSHSPYFALFIRSDPLQTNHSWNFPS